MTPHEKVMYIIDQLELSDRKVSEVVGKSVSAVTHRRSGIRQPSSPKRIGVIIFNTIK